MSTRHRLSTGVFCEEIVGKENLQGKKEDGGSFRYNFPIYASYRLSSRVFTSQSPEKNCWSQLDTRRKNLKRGRMKG